MAIPWGLVAIVVGALYGYFKKGKQDKSEIFKTGVIWGLIVALIFAVLGALADTNPVGFGAGFLGTALAFIILTALFVLGVLIGDWLEGR